MDTKIADTVNKTKQKRILYNSAKSKCAIIIIQITETIIIKQIMINVKKKLKKNQKVRAWHNLITFGVLTS